MKILSFSLSFALSLFVSAFTSVASAYECSEVNPKAKTVVSCDVKKDRRNNKAMAKDFPHISVCEYNGTYIFALKNSIIASVTRETESTANFEVFTWNSGSIKFEIDHTEKLAVQTLREFPFYEQVAYNCK